MVLALVLLVVILPFSWNEFISMSSELSMKAEVSGLAAVVVSSSLSLARSGSINETDINFLVQYIRFDSFKRLTVFHFFFLKGMVQGFYTLLSLGPEVVRRILRNGLKTKNVWSKFIMISLGAILRGATAINLWEQSQDLAGAWAFCVDMRRSAQALQYL